MRCVVSTCNNDSYSTSSQGITFHKFPLEPSLRVTWLKALDREAWPPNEDSMVCSYHFLITDLYLTKGGLCKLREGAVPMVFKQEEPNNDSSMVTCDIKVCRICYNTDCNLYSMKLFKKLHQAYGTLTGLLFENEDFMPPYLCSQCAHQLMNSVSFRNKIIQSHLNLQEIFKKNGCITLESIKHTDEDQGLDNSNLSTENKTYQYNIEIEHVKNENVDPGEQICPSDLNMPYKHIILDGIKTETDVLKQDINKHQDTEHDIVYSPSLHKYIASDGVKEERDDEYIPDSFNYQDATNYDIVANCNAFEDGDYTVNQAVTAEEMAKFNDDKVKILSKKPKSLIQSILDNHSNALPEIENTPILDDKISLDYNSTCETAEKPFTCDICKKSFSQKSWLLNHARIHSGERPYSCDMCKKSFNDKSNYRKHLRIHSGEKPYPCTFCGKAFNRKNYLENHLRTHSGEKPYSCNICNKVFGHKHHLKSHLRIHSGEKPYSCHICHKEIREKSNLHMHLKVHSGEKLHSCAKCKISFSTRYLLKSHTKNCGKKQDESKSNVDNLEQT